MSERLKYQTLHSHTTASDGLLTHKESLAVCEQNNIGVIAFTDHDSLPNSKTLDFLKKYQNDKTDWIIGIEISSGPPESLPDLSSPHIIGLFVDPNNKNLLNHCKKAQDARKQRMRDIVKNLKQLGFDISEEDCLKASSGESVGRPHIVKAIKSKPKNLDVIAKLVKKMENDSEKNPELKLKYGQMIKEGETQYPYVLFLTDNAYIKGVYVNYLYKPSLEQTASLIRNAEGVAIFAHWFTQRKDYTKEVLTEIFSSNTLDGAETVYGMWTGGGGRNEAEFSDDRKVLQPILKKFDKIESGGIDAHKQEDFELFSQVKNKWYTEHTVGMVQKIIKSKQVDTTWSSLS